MYNVALEEYEMEDENGKYRLVYAYFGSAIYYSQVVEESYSMMLWTSRIVNEKVKTNKIVNQIIDSVENSKKTMGSFLNEIQKVYSLTEDIVKELKWILEKRNYLVHKYFKNHIQKFYSDLGRKEMLQYFCEFIDRAKNIDSELTKYYRRYTDLIGLTEERIEEMLQQFKDEEIKRENDFMEKSFN